MFSDIELSVELFIPWVMRILNPDLLFFILLALVVCASLIKLILSTLPAMAIRKKMKIITPIRYLINSMIKSLVVFAGSLFAFPAWAYLFNDVALFNLVTHTKLISLLVVSCLCFYSIFVVYVSSREMCYWLVRNKTRD